MAARDELDLANLPRFLSHSAIRHTGLAAFIRHLLDTGGEISDFWGPEQMDVWSLTIRRKTRLLHFGIERGFADGVGLGVDDEHPSGFVSFSFAMLGWARSCGAELTLKDPDQFDPDIAQFGPPTLEWIDAGNDATIDRIRAAWAEYSKRRYEGDARLEHEWLAGVKAHGIEAIEAAAAPAKAPGSAARYLSDYNQEIGI